MFYFKIKVTVYNASIIGLPQTIQKLQKTSLKIKLKLFLLQSYNSTNF